MKSAKKQGLFSVTLIILLAGVIIFNLTQYLLFLKEKHTLMSKLREVEQRAAILEKEKQNLLQELEKEKAAQKRIDQEITTVQSTTKENAEKVSDLDARYFESQRIVEQLSARISALRAENLTLVEQKYELNTQLVQLAQENDILKAKLNSIPELKKAISDIKKKMSLIREEARRKSREKISRQIIGGNRGFLIKDGKPVAPARVKIEVIPAPGSAKE